MLSALTWNCAFLPGELVKQANFCWEVTRLCHLVLNDPNKIPNELLLIILQPITMSKDLGLVGGRQKELMNY